jgi:serine/threonine-protein kinase
VPESWQPYFTMELLEGGDIADLLEREGRLTLDETLIIIQQIGAALDYAHSQGVIHRDVKPANVLLKKDDGARFIKVVDFGIARAQEAKGGTRLTNSGVIIGTPEYMSP